MKNFELRIMNYNATFTMVGVAFCRLFGGSVA